MNKLMEIKKKADEIKELYNNYLKFKDQKFSYTNLETADGVLYLDEGVELAIGVPVYKMDENGQVLVAEDGSYQLTDGRMIEVVDGLIAEIADVKEEGEESPEETAAPEAEAMSEENPKDNVEDVEDATGGLEERVMALEGSLEKMMEMLQGLMSKQEEELTKINQKMNKIYMTNVEEFNRESSKTESVASKLSTSDIMTDIKNYSAMRGYKSTKKVESFGDVKDATISDKVKELQEAMSNARVSGGNGFPLSITK